MIADRVNMKKGTGLIWVDGFLRGTSDYGAGFLRHPVDYGAKRELNEYVERMPYKDYLPESRRRKTLKAPELALHAYFSNALPHNPDLGDVVVEPMFIDPKSDRKVAPEMEQIAAELYRRGHLRCENEADKYKAMIIAYEGGTGPGPRYGERTEVRLRIWPALRRITFHPVGRYEDPERFRVGVRELLRMLDEETCGHFDPDAQVARLYALGFRGGMETSEGKVISLRELDQLARSNSAGSLSQ